MPLYTPDADDALGPAFVGAPFSDPAVYTTADPAGIRVDSLFFYVAVQNEILALWRATQGAPVAAAGALALTSVHAGRTIYNTAALTATLPADGSVPLGTVLHFCCNHASNFRVQAQGGTQIRNGTVDGGGAPMLTIAGGYVETSAPGAFLTLIYLAANLWIARPMEANWAVQTS